MGAMRSTSFFVWEADFPALGIFRAVTLPVRSSKHLAHV